MKLPNLFESLGNSSDDIDNFKELNMSSADSVNTVSDEVSATENVNKINENGDIKAPEKLSNGQLVTDKENSGFNNHVMKSVVKKLLDSVPDHNSKEVQNSIANEKKNWEEHNINVVEKGNSYEGGVQDEGSSDEESLHLHLTEDEDSVNSSPKKDASSPVSTVNDEGSVINDCTKDEVEDERDLGKTAETNNEETDSFPPGNFVEHTTSVDEIRTSLPDCGILGQFSQETQSKKSEQGVCESRLSNMVSETSLDHSDESCIESNELSFSIEKEGDLNKAGSVESCATTQSSRVLNTLSCPNNSVPVNSDEQSGVVDLLTKPVESCDVVLRMDSDLAKKPTCETSADIKEEKKYLSDPAADKICDSKVLNTSSNDTKSCKGSLLEDKSDHLLTALRDSNESNKNFSVPQKSPPKADSEIPELEDKASDLCTPNNDLSSNVDDVKLIEVLTNSSSDNDKLKDKTVLENAENIAIHKNLGDEKNLEKYGSPEQIKKFENLVDQAPDIKKSSDKVTTQKLRSDENIRFETMDIEKLSMENEGGSVSIEQEKANDSEIQMKEDVKLKQQQLCGVIDSESLVDDGFCSPEMDTKCSIQKSSLEKEISCMVAGDSIIEKTETKVEDDSKTSSEYNSADNLKAQDTPMEEGDTGPKLKDETNITLERNSADNFQIDSAPFQGEREAETNQSAVDVCVENKKSNSSVFGDQSGKEMESEVNLIKDKEICSSEKSNEEKYGSKEVLNQPHSELMKNKKPPGESNLPNSTNNEDKLCSVNDLQKSISTSVDVDDVCLSHRLKPNSSQNDSFKLIKTGQQESSCKKMESTLFVKSVEDLNSSAISVNIFEDRKKSELDENMSDIDICGILNDTKQSSVQGIESKITLEVDEVTSEIGNQKCASNIPEVVSKNDLILQADENSESSDERTTVNKSNACENQIECETKLSSCDSRNSFTSSDLEMEASDCSSVPSQKAVSCRSATDMDQDAAESTVQSAHESSAGLGKRTRKRSHPDDNKDFDLKRTRQLVEVETKEEDAIALNRSKRMSSDTDLESVGPKKMCTDNIKSTEAVSKDNVPEAAINPMPFMQYLRTNHLKNLTRSELEEFVVQKVCEALTERSYVGVLRQQLQVQEQLVDVWQKKVQSLQKQVKDMDLVVKRFYNDQRQRKDRTVFPIKITRSVGLQVHMPTQRSHLPAEQEAIAAQMSKRKSFTPSQSPVLKSPTAGTSSPGGSTRGVGVGTQFQRSVAAGTSVSNLPNSPQVIRAGNVTSPAKLGSSLKTISPRLPQVVSNSQSTGNNTTVVNSAKYSVPIKPSRSQALYTVPNNTQPVPIQPKPAGQVIDLTDEEDRVRSAGLVRNIIQSTSQNTGTVNAVATVGSQGTIRVVSQPQLASPAAGNALLTPAATVGSTGRVTYLVPNSNASLQQRQVLLSSTSSQQIATNNAASVTNAGKSQMQALLLKNGSVVSMAPLVCPTTTQPILRTSVHTQQQQVVSSQRATQVRSATVSQVSSRIASYSKHPAQLPPCPVYNQGNTNWKKMPPPPELKLAKQNNKQQGIVLSWNMTISTDHEAIASYQLYAYQEGNSPPSTSHWKKVGDVKALPLPMACTLTQFVEGHKYHFAVRAVDIHSRVGPFSEPESIVLTRK